MVWEISLAWYDTCHRLKNDAVNLVWDQVVGRSKLILGAELTNIAHLPPFSYFQLHAFTLDH